MFMLALTKIFLKKTIFYNGKDAKPKPFNSYFNNIMLWYSCISTVITLNQLLLIIVTLGKTSSIYEANKSAGKTKKLKLKCTPTFVAFGTKNSGLKSKLSFITHYFI